MIVLFEDKMREAGADDAAQGARKRRSRFGRSAHRKAQAIADVSDGLLTPDEACERYGMHAEELAIWQRALRSFGLAARRAKPPKANAY
jgi:transposase-like protein